MKPLLGLCIVCLLGGAAYAQDLVFEPVNPSFGGNPLNASHLSSLATAQRTATAGQPSQPSRISSGLASQSSADLFARQLESRLMSALSNQVVGAIFGEDPQDTGEVTFGATTVSFDRTPEAINLVIVDTVDGTVTEISVPQLVTN